MKLEFIRFKGQHVPGGCLCLTAHIGIGFKIPIPVHIANGLWTKLRLSLLVRGYGTAYGARCLVHQAKLCSLQFFIRLVRITFYNTENSIRDFICHFCFLQYPAVRNSKGNIYRLQKSVRSCYLPEDIITFRDVLQYMRF